MGRRQQIIFVILALVVPLVAACGATRETPEDVARQAENAGDAVQASAADIMENRQQFVDQRVRVQDQIDRLVGENAFVTDEGLLVVADRLPEGLAEGQSFEVLRGQVRDFDRQQVERQLGIDLQDDLFKRFEGMPVLIGEEFELDR